VILEYTELNVVQEGLPDVILVRPQISEGETLAEFRAAVVVSACSRMPSELSLADRFR
jgi:hypothetical protein